MMAAGANGPMKYDGLTRVQSSHQESYLESIPERLTPSDADIRVCLPDFVDGLLGQSLGGGVNVERIVAREGLFPRRGVPICRVVVSATVVDPIQNLRSSYHLQ